MRILISVFLFMTVAAFGQPTNTPSSGNQRSVTVNNSGVLQSPTNFFAANSNLLNASVSSSGGGGSATNAISTVRSNGVSLTTSATELRLFNYTKVTNAAGVISLEQDVSTSLFNSSSNSLWSFSSTASNFLWSLVAANGTNSTNYANLKSAQSTNYTDGQIGSLSNNILGVLKIYSFNGLQFGVQGGTNIFLLDGASITNGQFRGTSTFASGLKVDTLTVSNVMTMADGSGNNVNLNYASGVFTMTGPAALMSSYDTTTKLWTWSVTNIFQQVFGQQINARISPTNAAASSVLATDSNRVTTNTSLTLSQANGLVPSLASVSNNVQNLMSFFYLILPTNGVAFSTNGTNITIRGAYVPGSNITLTTNSDGTITIAAAAGGSSGTGIATNSGTGFNNIFTNVTFAGTVTNLGSGLVGKWLFYDTNGVIYVGIGSAPNSASNSFYCLTTNGNGGFTAAIMVASAINSGTNQNVPFGIGSGLTVDFTARLITADPVGLAGSNNVTSAIAALGTSLSNAFKIYNFNSDQFASVNVTNTAIKPNAKITNVYSFGSVYFWGTDGVLGSEAIGMNGGDFALYSQPNDRYWLTYSNVQDTLSFRAQRQLFGTNPANGLTVIGPAGGIAIGATNAPGASNLVVMNNVTTWGTEGAGNLVSSNRITGLVLNLNDTGSKTVEYRTPSTLSASVTNTVGPYFFASGGTNEINLNSGNEFYLTNNMATNITLWITNGFALKEFYLNILAPTNGNNYNLTLYSANSWLMAWDRNCPTNGGTGSIITVTNNQSLEISGKFTPTPTNPIIKMVYSRSTL